ncbi:MAG: class I SAM-dependent methyltransferase [Gemmatimonadota bacterium]
MTVITAPEAPARQEPGELEQAFAGRMLQILNDGALAITISLGHRIGLFDVMDRMSPSSSAAIAKRAGLNERYVREWLGAMVVGGLIDYDPARAEYDLPPAHAAFLTRNAYPNNLAVVAQFIPVMGDVEDGIVESFRNGGGLGYECFPRFHDVMAEMSRQTVVSGLFDAILPLVPGLAGRLEAGIDVLDVGCGQGKALNALASAFPNSRFRGIDLCRETVETARAASRELRLSNLHFEQQDAAAMRASGAYDLITCFDSVHDQAQPAVVLGNIRRALRPAGTLLMQDIAASSQLENNIEHPLGPLLYTISLTHCTTVSLAQDGAGLGTCWGREAAEGMLREAGFQNVDVHELPHDMMNYFYVATA